MIMRWWYVLCGGDKVNIIIIISSFGGRWWRCFFVWKWNGENVNEIVTALPLKKEHTSILPSIVCRVLLSVFPCGPNDLPKKWGGDHYLHWPFEIQPDFPICRDHSTTMTRLSGASWQRRRRLLLSGLLKTQNELPITSCVSICRASCWLLLHNSTRFVCDFFEFPSSDWCVLLFSDASRNGL